MKDVLDQYKKTIQKYKDRFKPKNPKPELNKSIDDSEDPVQTAASHAKYWQESGNPDDREALHNAMNHPTLKPYKEAMVSDVIQTPGVKTKEINGQKYIQLHRGVGKHEGGVHHINDYNSASWTTDPTTAKNFAESYEGKAIKRWIPANRISFSMAHGHHVGANTHGGESEVISDHNGYSTKELNAMNTDAYRKRLEALIPPEKRLKKSEPLRKVAFDAQTGKLIPESKDPEGLEHPEQSHYVKGTSVKTGKRPVWEYRQDLANMQDKSAADNLPKLKEKFPHQSSLIDSLHNKLLYDPDRHNVDRGIKEPELRMRHFVGAAKGDPGYKFESSPSGLVVSAERHSRGKDKVLHSWHFDGKSLKFLGEKPISNTTSGGKYGFVKKSKRPNSSRDNRSLLQKTTRNQEQSMERSDSSRQTRVGSGVSEISSRSDSSARDRSYGKDFSQTSIHQDSSTRSTNKLDRKDVAQERESLLKSYGRRYSRCRALPEARQPLEGINPSPLIKSYQTRYNKLQKSYTTEDLRKSWWYNHFPENLEMLQKSKKDAKQMLPDPQHKPVIDWAYNTLPNDNWAMWFLRNYKKDPSILNDKNQEDLKHFAGMASTTKDIGDHRFEKEHDFNTGIKHLKDKEEEWQNKQGDQLVNEKGTKLIDLGNGQAWWDLGVSSCSEEGAAMGHCGNTASTSKGDRVLSLRQQKGKKYEPSLTFIENNGWLGEMKGRANQKPHPKYHSAIKTLLEHPRIKHIAGGGYADEMNFDLDDMDPEMKQEILSKKPDLDLKSSDDPHELEQKLSDIESEKVKVPPKHDDIINDMELKRYLLQSAKERNLDVNDHILHDYLRNEPAAWDPKANLEDTDSIKLFKLMQKTPERIKALSDAPGSDVRSYAAAHPMAGKDYVDKVFENFKTGKMTPSYNELSVLGKHPNLTKDHAESLFNAGYTGDFNNLIKNQPDLFSKTDIDRLSDSTQFKHTYLADQNSFTSDHAKKMLSQSPEKLGDAQLHLAIIKLSDEHSDELYNSLKNKQNPRSLKTLAIRGKISKDNYKHWLINHAPNTQYYNLGLNDTHQLDKLSRDDVEDVLQKVPKFANQADAFKNVDPKRLVKLLHSTDNFDLDRIKDLSSHSGLQPEHMLEVMDHGHSNLVTNGHFFKNHPNANADVFKQIIHNSDPESLIYGGDINKMLSHPNATPDTFHEMYNKLSAKSDEFAAGIKRYHNLGDLWSHSKTPAEVRQKIVDSDPGVAANYSKHRPETITDAQHQQLVDKANPIDARELIGHPKTTPEHISSMKDRLKGHKFENQFDITLKEHQSKMQKSLKKRYEKLQKSPLVNHDLTPEDISASYGHTLDADSDHQHLASYKKRNNYHHVFQSTDPTGGQYYTHILSTSINPFNESGHIAMAEANSVDAHSKHDPVQVYKINSKEVGKGHGQELHEGILSHHGHILSDYQLSPGADKLYRDKLPRLPGVSAKMGLKPHEEHEIWIDDRELYNKHADHRPILKLQKSNHMRKAMDKKEPKAWIPSAADLLSGKTSAPQEKPAKKEPPTLDYSKFNKPAKPEESKSIGEYWKAPDVKHADILKEKQIKQKMIDKHSKNPNVDLVQGKNKIIHVINKKKEDDMQKGAAEDLNNQIKEIKNKYQEPKKPSFQDKYNNVKQRYQSIKGYKTDTTDANTNKLGKDLNTQAGSEVSANKGTELLKSLKSMKQEGKIGKK